MTPGKLIGSKIILVCTVALLIASTALTQKLTVDVDKTFDFGKFRSFGWAEGQVAPNPATGQMLVSAVERELNSRGLIRNDTEPDIKIAVMAAPEMDLQGVGPSWNNAVYRSWGGYGNPAALMTVTKGTLLIDLIEVKDKFSIWRGVAKDIFVKPPSGDPQKDARHMEELVNKTVRKLFEKYPVKPHR